MLTERDVRELLALKSETKNLDYKQSMHWGTATAEIKAEIIKDVLAMANAQDGGRIIFGVRDGDFAEVGMTPEEFESFDSTRFADFLSRYADPLFECGIHKFTIEGTRFVAIEVPEFTDVPIICKADINDRGNRLVLKRGATYIRTDRAASEVVGTADAMRDLMNRAVVKRGDQLLRMVERLIKGKRIGPEEGAAQEIAREVADADRFILDSLPEGFRHSGRWEVEFHVLPYQHERVPDLASVTQLLTASHISLRGWSFPHLDREHTANFARGVQSYTATPGLVRRHLEGYRAYQSGVFVWKSEYWEDSRPELQGQRALSFVGVILNITEYFLFAKRYFEALAPDGTVCLTVRLTETQDRFLTSLGEAGDLFDVYVCHEPQIQAETICTVAELAASYDEFARKAIRRVYELFNWNDSRDELMRGWQERLVNRRL